MGELGFETSDNLDLSRGYKKYESLVKNINGIFKKIEGIFDISEYKRELATIQEEACNDKSIDSQMPSNEMQLEYEGMVLAPYINRLEDLTSRVEKECLPFYELHLLTSKIDIGLSKITEDTIADVINSARQLVDAINSLNTHNEQDKNKIIDKAYKTLYKVLLHEEMFDRGDIFEYLKRLNIPANRENLGRILSSDLDKLDKEIIIDDDLKTLSSEKLGNDYLSRDVIKKLSYITVGSENSEYQERRRRAIDEVREDVESLIERKNSLVSKLSDNKNNIRSLQVRKSLLAARVASLVLVPVVLITAGNSIGKSKSAKITEFRTATRTIDYDTGKLIGDVEYSFDEEKTPYVATVLSCSPWRKNPAGIGYIRNVTTYEYIAPDGADESHRINDEDLKNNVREKYTYIEPKDELDAEDSLENTTILITESYPDGESRPSTKFIIPFTVGGVVLALLIDLILILSKLCSIERIKYILDDLSDEIKTRKLNNEQIVNRLNELREEAETIKEKYNDTVVKYGSWGDSLITDAIDSSWVTGKKPKKLIKK